ncbi:MAG: mce5A [Nocardia sp.]|uniref:MlaD family protein n=1 Tax=Nocardia sp. TaxID=1821 RepID=UPI0026260CD6|nr:MCE family protein [Nocardia sp.]MCU1647695.1 mce5A [Nocardia sp.]
MIKDPTGRGPSGRQLLVAGLALIVVIATATTLLLLRYSGKFTSRVPVVAELMSTGDGLPAGSDVKFRGLTIGRVQSSEAAASGDIQRVAIDLKPEFAGGVPSTVTARVVPANVFAVTSIELLDNGPAAPLTSGSVIHQDRTKETVALQSALTTFRNVLTKLEPEKLGRILNSLSDALNGSARMPGSTLERLDHWLTAVDQVGIASDLQNFTAAASGLDQSAPALLDLLSETVTTARTIADRQDKLTALLTTASGTVDVVNRLFARNPDTGKELVAGLSDTFGALAADPEALPQAMANFSDTLQKYSTTFHPDDSGKLKWQWSIDVSLTPFQQYTRADCPHYGELAGPSCGTAPTVAESSDLPAGLLPGLPADPVHPAALRGPAAVAGVLGRNPNATQLILLGAALTGGAVYPVNSEGVPGQ